MKLKLLMMTAALAAALAVPASALDYTIDGPGPDDFGTPTSDETVYVGTEYTVNVDKSKNAALIPPAFGTPTSNLPGSGEPLTPNLTGNSGTVTAINPSTGGGTIAYPGGTVEDTPNYPTTAYTAVTSDLYYSGGHLGTLKIPTLGLTVKVYQGTDSTQLAKGAGHFTGTSIWDGNVCVAAVRPDRA